MNKEELKSMGLLERIAHLTSKYENEIADLRVDLTLMDADNKQLEQEKQELMKLLQNPVEEKTGG